MVIEGACVSIAMYCLIQFYIQLKDDLAEHRPLLKVLAIKLVIFLSFWQTLLISFLTSSGAIKASDTIDIPDVKIGIPSMLLCIEMAIFSVFHLWAFPWQVYDINRSSIVAGESAPGFLPDPKTAYQGGPLGSRALMDAFNPWDFVKATGRAFRWIAVGRRRRMEDPSYHKTSAPGAGLEPTRNQFTAFNTYGGSNPYDEGGGGSGLMEAESTAYSSTTAGKGGKYQHVNEDDRAWNDNTYDEEDDEDALLSKPQANPISPPYPRPMSRLPPPQSGRGAVPTNTSAGPPTAPHGDIGAAGKPLPPHQPPPPSSQLAPPYPLSPTSASFPSSSNTNNNKNNHGRVPSAESSHSLSHPGSSLTPDPHPLGPAGGRRSAEQEEWEEHDGYDGGYVRGEDERDLGGGHGVRDNRF